MMILINPAGTQNTGLYSVRAKHVNEYEQASHALIKLHDRYSVQLLLLQSEVRTEVLPYFYCTFESTKVPSYLRTSVDSKFYTSYEGNSLQPLHIPSTFVPSYYFYVLSYLRTSYYTEVRKYGSTFVLASTFVLSYESTKVLRKYV
jgi:hypothetical protein